MNKRAAAVALLVVGGATLVGCTPATPLEAGTQMCVDSLQYEIEQVVTEPTAGWADSELEPEVTSHDSPEDSEYVHNIYGTAAISLSDGSVVNVTWECFTQTIEGKTYASVIRVDGECSRTHREALEESGKPGCD